MIETIASAWDLFIHILSTGPLGLWAPVLGTLTAWGVTQWVKRELPCGVPDQIIKVIAFLVGFVVSAALNPSAVGLVAAINVGLWAPAGWELFILAIGWKWPTARMALSRDVKRWRK